MSAINITISSEESAVRLVYKNLLQAWNTADAKAFAGLFAKEGFLIGFDGSQGYGREEIETQLAAIFKDHKTASFVNIIREVRFISPDIAILRSVVGMVPPGKVDINPALNAIQVAVIRKEDDQYRIVHFQNTPAAYHGRPEESKRLNDELSEALRLAKDAG